MYSEAAAERVDIEVEELLEQAHRQAYAVLTEHRASLEQLAQALLQEEVLERDQVLAIVSGAPAAQRGTRGGKSDENTKGKPVAEIEHQTLNDSSVRTELASPASIPAMERIQVQSGEKEP